jgi:CTP synthase
MHVAVVEFARNVAGLKDANSSEFNEFTQDAVIYLMQEWFDERSGSVEKRDESSDKGATMRLGAYPCRLKKGTLAYRAYGDEDISERHRHSYEFNNDYKALLVEKGLVVSGSSPTGDLVEIIEIEDHPWYLGCQFHPEFKSRPMDAHPLFRDYIKAALEYSKRRVG